MGTILNLNWRYVDEAGSDVVGWPVPTPSATPYRSMAAMIPEIAAAGFSAIGLPPSTLGAAGIFSGGYDLKDPYCLEGTAFGSAEDLRMLVAVAHAHGIAVYGDLVLHQMDGSADGNYPTKRFPKTPSCFSGIPGGVAADVVPDQTGNFSFGQLCAYQHGVLSPGDAPGYMHDGAIAAAQWLVRTVGFDGVRIDDAKGTNAQVVYDILHADYLSDLFAFFEYFDGSPGPVSNYVNGYERRRGCVMDFALKFNAGNICNNNSRVWMGQCATLGWCDVDGATALTFVESADTDTSPGEQTIWNKVLGYALMAVKPGYPSFYYRDWSSDPRCYGLKPTLNNLLWIHEKLAQGDQRVLLDNDPQVFVCERTGYGGAPGCVAFFNNDQWNSYTRTVQPSFGANRQMHEYTGNGSVDDIWTDGEGRLTATVPRNDNGFGYVIYAPAGVEGAVRNAPWQTMQTFFGASDLVNMPALPEAARLDIGRVSLKAGSSILLTLTPDQTGWGNSAEVAIDLYDPSGDVVASFDFDDQADGAAQALQRIARVSGLHSIVATTSGLPPGGSAYQLSVLYTGALGDTA